MSSGCTWRVCDEGRIHIQLIIPLKYSVANTAGFLKREGHIFRD